jgi:hypothetical protein
LTVLIESHYLPCLAFFAVAGQAKTLKLEKHEHFVKQSFRNRCYINTEHGVDSLHVPLTQKHGKVRISDVRIDHTQKWVNNHWRSVMSAYGKAPFYEYYSDDLEKILFRKHDFLYDLNIELLTLCLKWLKWQIAIKETTMYEKVPQDEGDKEVKDLRGLISPKTKGKISQVYRPVPYTQVFGNAFVDNPSLIDVIFCCGPEAGRIVKASSLAE